MKAKWIGGILGFALGGGILGAIAGYALGSLFDTSSDGPDPLADSPAKSQERARNNFLFSLMVLSAHMIQADGKIMHSEMEFMRRFLRRNTFCIFYRCRKDRDHYDLLFSLLVLPASSQQKYLDRDWWKYSLPPLCAPLPDYP